MYIPPLFKEEDKAEIEKHIREFGFGILVSSGAGVPIATHLPFELEINQEGEWLLLGHLSRANPQWKNFEVAKEVLVIFSGPHAYVSPSWYTQVNVPTWNYRAVHVYGKITLVEGEKLEYMLSRQMEKYETAHAQKPLSYKNIPADMLAKDLAGVIGFEIKAERIEAASKLSQNRDAESFSRVVDALKKSEAYDSKRIAQEMEKIKKQP